MSVAETPVCFRFHLVQGKMTKRPRDEECEFFSERIHDDTSLHYVAIDGADCQN